MLGFHTIKSLTVSIAAFALVAFSSTCVAEELNYLVGRVKLGIETESGTNFTYGPMLAAITQKPHLDEAFLVEVDDQGYFIASVDSIDLPYRVWDVRYNNVTYRAFNSQVFAFYRFRQNQTGQPGDTINLMDIGETTILLKRDERLSCNIYLNKITLKLDQKSLGGSDIDAGYELSTGTDRASYPASQYFSNYSGNRQIRDIASFSLWENRRNCNTCTYEVSFWPEDVWPFKITLEK